jgi:cytoskeletal protein RodZ
MTDQGANTLGQYLKRKRESQLIPIQKIALAIDAKKELVQALEEDNYELFTQRAQVQALVKQVAAFLKLDESYVLLHFNFQWKEHSQKKGFPKLSSFKEDDNNRHKTDFTYRTKIASVWQISALSRLKFPSVSRLPDMPLILKNRFTLSVIILAILLVGFFLPIDLPFSKQKSPPPGGGRFRTEQPHEVTKEPFVQNFPARISVSPSTSAQEKSNSDNIRKGPLVQNVPARISESPSMSAQEKSNSDNIRKGPLVQNVPARTSISPSTSAQEKSNSGNKGIKVVGNSDSKRYHLPGMKYYDKVRASHRVIFNSEEEAIKSGYYKARQ